MPFNIGDVVQTISSDRPEALIRILRVGRFNLHIREGGNVSANGGIRGPTEENSLNPPKSELIEVIGVGFDCGLNYLRLTLRQPSSVIQLGTSRNPTGGIITSMDSPRNNPLPISFFIAYERQIATEFLNNHDQALRPTLRYVGYRYEIEYLGTAEIDRIKQLNIPIHKISYSGFRS